MKKAFTSTICSNLFSKIAKGSIRVRYFSNPCQIEKSKNFNPFKRKSFIKFGNDPKIATRICLTILGNGGLGQPRCVALFTDLKAFLFNCGEGVGRLCREYEVDFHHIRNIFITHKSWQNMSGLPDVYLTNEVFGVPKINLYGPPGIENFTSLITSHQYGIIIRKKNSYSDENMEVTSIEINAGKENPDVCHTYVCKIHERLGDLNPEKCVELGVPIGPLLLTLKNGEDVTLPSGRVVRSVDVLDSIQHGITFLVVDCPSDSFLDAFVTEKKFLPYQLPSDDASKINFVFHFTSSNIMQSEKYQKWMEKFHQSTQHYILNSSNVSASSGAVNQTQNVLHLLHPEIFKLLPSEENKDTLNWPASLEIVHPPPMLQIYLRPEKKLSWQNVIQYNTEDYSEMRKEFTDFNSELENLKYNIAKQVQNFDTNEYPEVIFLGTSSATSTAFRNVSAILVHINSHQSILMDCGEGTYLQMVRYFGRSKVASELTKLCCIFITHKHTDHYMGLFRVLSARKEAFESLGLQYQPTILILPFLVNSLFQRFCEIFEISRPNVKVLSCKSISGTSNDLLRKILGDVKFNTVPVKHCKDAYGMVLQIDSKWKIVYSGDTCPCQALIEAGENCNLLIHEASIDDNLATEATLKMHSTPAQVVDVAEKMNAQYTIMTHFSKRYLDVPIFQECNHKNIGFAFDFMRIRLHDLPVVPLFLPALKCLFEEQWENHLEKSTCTKQFENVFLKTYRALRTS